MPDQNTAFDLRIGLVGGGALCREVLERIYVDPGQTGFQAHISAVVDSNQGNPGILFARLMGLTALEDPKELYRPQYKTDLIFMLTPDQKAFDEILQTKPPHICVLSYPAFQLFWQTISLESERARDMQTILNGIQDFILVITPDRQIVDVNEAFLKQMGYAREEVLGRQCHEVFQGRDQNCNHGKLICPLNETIRNKRPSLQVLTRQDHNGEKRYVEVAVFPIWEKDGKISRFIEISRDITDRKKEEEEITNRLEHMVEERTRQLEETHAKLIHQDKMASLGKLSASVVHEINNPIAGILNLEMLIKRILEEGPPSQKDLNRFIEYLTLMETETRRIGRIVSNLLAFSRQSKLELKQIKLNRLIEKTLFLNDNLLKLHRVNVEKRLDPDLPDLVGSEDQLQQVLMNFISNASEAMNSAGGGVLTIESRHIPGDQSVEVAFEDNGIGIPKKNLPRLFEPFFTTKKKGKGVGLGLSVAYGIIEEHEGSIHVASELGQGTRISIRLPLKQPSRTSDPQGGLHGQHENPDR